MATQRVIVAKIVGDAVPILIKRFAAWPARDPRDEDEPVICNEVDDFVAQLRANAHRPPIIYFTERVDPWSIGDLLPGLGNESARVVRGKQFEVALHQPPVEVAKRIIGNALTPECKWLRARIREAEDGWVPTAARAVIVVA